MPKDKDIHLFNAFHNGRYVIVIQIGNEKIGLTPDGAREAADALISLIKDCKYMETVDRDCKGDN